eukprot:3079837-Prymnesium_polylepis.1
MSYRWMRASGPGGRCSNAPLQQPSVASSRWMQPPSRSTAVAEVPPPSTARAANRATGPMDE